MKKILFTIVCFAAALIAFCSCSPSSKTEAADKDKSIGINIYRQENWEESGKYCEKFTIPLKNSSEGAIDNWSINIFFSEEIEGINSIWNGKSSVKGRVVTITPMDYNNTIPSGAASETGFIAKFNKKPQILASALYVNGERINITEPVSETVSAPTEAKVFVPSAGTPLAQNGKLSVNGSQLVNSKGENIILQGVSTHGIAWFPQYVNKDAFKTLRDTMNVDTIRLALYSSPNEGFKKELYANVENGIKYASELGMYVIADWHVLGSGNPNTDKENAKDFFTKISSEFKNYDNVIYEICNEPNGNVTWEDDIKPYAMEIIPIIKAQNKDAVIIVGTPTWSQDVDIAAADPITGYNNIMYAFHFYAATHKAAYRDKVQKAYDSGLPVFVSEFGICDASGNGNLDEAEADIWISFLKQKGISYVCWSLCNKNESASLLSPSCQTLSNWADSDLSPAGKWLKKTYTTTG